MDILGSQEAALRNASSGYNLHYKVNFPLQNPIPKLTKMFYNGQLICSGPAEQASYRNAVTTIDLERTLITTVSSQVPSSGMRSPSKSGRSFIFQEYPNQGPTQVPSVMPWIITSTTTQRNRVPITTTVVPFKPAVTTERYVFLYVDMGRVYDELT